MVGGEVVVAVAQGGDEGRADGFAVLEQQENRFLGAKVGLHNCGHDVGARRVRGLSLPNKMHHGGVVFERRGHDVDDRADL